MENEQYTTEMQRLFQEWSQRQGKGLTKKREEEISFLIDHTASFIRDGVVCPETWFAQSIRPLYLLKEAYGEGNWDLVADHLCKTKKIGRGQMWRRVSEWTYGLLSTTKTSIAPYQGWNVVDHYGNEYLQKTAVVNVKKSGGASNSDMDNIRAYAEFDKEYLFRELELCDPTIIICGYTASVLDIIFQKPVREKRNANLFYHMALNGHDVLVLDYWHPANQYPDIMNYYGLMGIYQQALLAGEQAVSQL